MATRAIYYGARLISSQHGTVFTKSNYQDIQKVYSIWICPDPQGKTNSSITRFHITKEDVVGKSLIEKADYDKVEVVVLNLGKNDEETIGSRILDLLSTLFSVGIPLEDRKRKPSEVYGIKMTEEIGREVSEVYDLSYGIEQAGINKGYKIGKEEGVEEGQLKMLFKLFIDGKLSLTDAATQVNMTEEEFLKKKEEYEKSHSNV